jgi:cell division protein FtsI (penicillin-binding protein 3)
MDKKQLSILRFGLVVLLFVLFGIAILFKAGHTMFVRKDYWLKAASRFRKDSIIEPARRGNIYSSDGKLLASSMPQYKIFMDFMVIAENKKLQQKVQHKRDSLLKTHVGEIARGMHRILGKKSTFYYRNLLTKGRDKEERHLLLYPQPISYLQYKALKKLPVFNLSGYKGGFHVEKLRKRVRPFDRMAERTLGKVYGQEATKSKYQGRGKFGLEYSFDSLLAGTPGMKHREKVMNKYIDFIDKEPIDGCDIITTIDVHMQELVEEALVAKLKEVNAMAGTVVLMETKTGNIKAIANLDRARNGRYYEHTNRALVDLSEPGSTFKTVSMAIALENGLVTPDTKINTGNGHKKMYGRTVNDWRSGGFGILTPKEVLRFSSNIGIATVIDDYYHAKPKAYVEEIYKLGLNIPLNLQLKGAAKPYIPTPEKCYWDDTKLAWMSFGYNTQIPCINLITFYNAIANQGKMVKPRFVTEILRNDSIIKQFPVEVLREQICSKRTIRQLTEMLEFVVEDGLKRRVYTDKFRIAGKTGTAQLSHGKAGYRAGKMSYYVSFCGFFPVENPKYTCIVGIRKRGKASGGSMAGPVFRDIAEAVYTLSEKENLRDLKDSITIIPRAKTINLAEERRALHGLNYVKQLLPEEKTLSASAIRHRIKVDQYDTIKVNSKDSLLVPRVIGLGAKDAIYILEKENWKITLNGRGHVQSTKVHFRNKVKQITLELN